MHVALVDLTVREKDIDEYVGSRRSNIHPALRQVSGFQNSLLLRERDTASDALRLRLVDLWESDEHHRRFAATDSPDVLAPVAHLMKDVTTRSYERLEWASTTVGDLDRAGKASIGVHQAQEGRGEEYLGRRRDIVQPSMSSAAGFVGEWMLADPEVAERYTAIALWESHEASRVYGDLPEHRGPIANAVRSITADKRPGITYDVLLVT